MRDFSNSIADMSALIQLIFTQPGELFKLAERVAPHACTEWHTTVPTKFQANKRAVRKVRQSQSKLQPEYQPQPAYGCCAARRLCVCAVLIPL
jgi:hypothetical protein